MKYFLWLLIFLPASVLIYPQVENIPSDNPVYPFLKQMQVKGIIPEYDDFIIPLSRGEIIRVLTLIQDKETELSVVERELLEKHSIKLGAKGEPLNLISDFPDAFLKDKLKNLAYYHDSLLNFSLNPIIGFRTIGVTNEFENTTDIAYLGKLGGNLYGTYDNWLGFFLEGSNEAVWGSREAALKDPVVAQSFSFNETEVNFVDNTAGYLRVENKHVGLQLGRERLLWGSGYDERMVLSDNPQLFDFFRFSFTYKAFSYNFIHGWLVQEPFLIEVDSLLTIKDKPSKYIALSRLGFNPSDNIKLGISQFVIYSNRPFEAAYLNPLLFWESAQRSMNDLDNSFLSLDLRFLIINGLELNSSILLDDIHFVELFNNWNDVSNRNAWNVGLSLSAPILFPDIAVILDYVQVRPYMFSHPGVGEMLTYTNNGYQLGIPYEPNSSSFNVKAAYQFTSELLFDIKYNYSLHGDNIRDEEGNVIKNVGGNILEYYTINDSDKIALLEGDLEKKYTIDIGITYEPVYFFFFNARYIFFNDGAQEDLLQLSFNYRIL